MSDASTDGSATPKAAKPSHLTVLKSKWGNWTAPFRRNAIKPVCTQCVREEQHDGLFIEHLCKRCGIRYDAGYAAGKAWKIEHEPEPPAPVVVPSPPPAPIVETTPVVPPTAAAPPPAPESVHPIDKVLPTSAPPAPAAPAAPTSPPSSPAAEPAKPGEPAAAPPAATSPPAA